MALPIHAYAVRANRLHSSPETANSLPWQISSADRAPLTPRRDARRYSTLDNTHSTHHAHAGEPPKRRFSACLLLVRAIRQLRNVLQGNGPVQHHHAPHYFTQTTNHQQRLYRYCRFPGAASTASIFLQRPPQHRLLDGQYPSPSLCTQQSLRLKTSKSQSINQYPSNS